MRRLALPVGIPPRVEPLPAEFAASLNRLGQRDSGLIRFSLQSGNRRFGQWSGALGFSDCEVIGKELLRDVERDSATLP